MFKLHEICQFGQFILGKIIKIVATRSYFLKVKCIRFDFGWDSAPESAGGAHSAPPDPLAGFYGVLLLREGKGGKEGRTWKGRKE